MLYFSSTFSSPFSLRTATLVFFLSLAFSFLIFFFSTTVLRIFWASSISPRQRFLPLMVSQNRRRGSDSDAASWGGTIWKSFLMLLASTLSSYCMMKRDSCFNYALPACLSFSSRDTSPSRDDPDPASPYSFSCSFRMVFWISLVRSFLRTWTTFFWRVATQLPPFFCLGGCAKPLGAPRGMGMKNLVILWIYKQSTGNCSCQMGGGGIKVKRMSFRKYFKPLTKFAKSERKMVTKEVEKQERMERKAEVVCEAFPVQEKEVKSDFQPNVKEIEPIVLTKQINKCEQAPIIVQQSKQQEPVKEQAINQAISPQDQQESTMMEEELQEEQPQFTTQEILEKTIETINRLQSLRNGSTEEFVTLTKNLRILQGKKPSLHVPYSFPPPLYATLSPFSFN